MKRFILTTLILGLAIAMYAQKQTEKPQPQWVDLQQIFNAKDNSKITMVYVYRTPCNLCPALESTFSDSTIIKALQKDFNATKFDSESQTNFLYQGKNYPYLATSEEDGINAFAVVLLDGKMAFPSLVFFNNSGEKIGVHNTPENTSEVVLILKYYSSKDYLKTPYDEWIKKNLP